MTFLNRTETLETSTGWNAEDLPKLWLYNAHYFDDLVADDCGSRTEWHRNLITRWIAENPPGTGNGWEPYPTSLRIVNWAKWLLCGNPSVPGMLVSLATQADWLTKRLEHHLLGNHLFANAKALVFAGSVLDAAPARQWLETGMELLDREIPEQILTDGGHFERSIMYHAILTEDMLDLVQLAQFAPDDIGEQRLRNWRARCEQMLYFLTSLTHPDGRIAFFNDGAFGIAPEPDALIAMAEALGVSSTQPDASTVRFTETGYASLRTPRATLLTDVAPIGPDYLPGHAHADTLSFELSIDGQRIFVNGGTSVYGGDPEQRHLERSTRNHNTIEIDGDNSSEIWSDFRVARRAKVESVQAGQEGSTQWLQASHDGYRRNSGPIHTRRWELTDTSLKIHDTLDRPANEAIARFRLHPDLSSTSDTITGSTPIQVRVSGGSISVEPGVWSPEFGKTLPCEILTLRLTGQESTVTFTWDA
ncbi:MAG: alginate lyase family protein [Pseudomonadota bacterium]